MRKEERTLSDDDSKEVSDQPKELVGQGVMITTTDNPFSPFTEFKEWYSYDELKGYRTLSLLASVTNTSPNLSFVDQELAIDRAIDEMIEYNILGIYKKVYEPETL